MKIRDRLRFLAVTTVGAYVVINLLMVLLRPVTRGLPQLGMTALIVPPMVLAMVHLVIPLARRLAQGASSAATTRAQA